MYWVSPCCFLCVWQVFYTGGSPSLSASSSSALLQDEKGLRRPVVVFFRSLQTDTLILYYSISLWEVAATWLSGTVYIYLCKLLLHCYLTLFYYCIFILLSVFSFDYCRGWWETAFYFSQCISINTMWNYFFLESWKKTLQSQRELPRRWIMATVERGTHDWFLEFLNVEM